MYVQEFDIFPWYAMDSKPQNFYFWPYKIFESHLRPTEYKMFLWCSCKGRVCFLLTSFWKRYTVKCIQDRVRFFLKQYHEIWCCLWRGKHKFHVWIPNAVTYNVTYCKNDCFWKNFAVKSIYWQFFNLSCDLKMSDKSES